VISKPSPSLQARRAEHARYKEDVKKEGKPFFPYAMFDDTVMSLVVVIVIIALACVWKWTIPGHHSGTEAGWLGPLYSDQADPGTTSFVPRPTGTSTSSSTSSGSSSAGLGDLGTVGIPTVIMVLGISLPFLDRRQERRLSRRPVAVIIFILTVIAMGTLTYKGATAKEALGSETVAAVPGWVKKNNLPPAAVPGAKLFAQSGCLTCHTYLGTGSSNLGAPDLSAEGAKGRGLQFQIDHLKCPSCVNPGSPMPPFASLGDENIRKIAIFLEASKGGK
jgi:ubiquinol-cytochrome c reductase cytochrome b subunit/menaquinol-cytochrome c reductase cytochrome b/c subunit